MIKDMASAKKKSNQKLGIIGLGKIGGNLALQAMAKGISVVGKARHRKPELEKRGIKVTGDYYSFVGFLEKPRIIYLSLPAGPTIDSVLNELVPLLDKGDVILDGGNSFYLDSVEREKRISKAGIFFLDCGTSGGLTGARTGACFMVGGKRQGVRIVEPLLKTLAINNDGFVYTGKAGSGHFVKLVHNGIEFAMLQAIGEGTALMHAARYDLDLEKIFRNWSNGSVIRGCLVELMYKGLAKTKIDDISDYVEDTGEVNWLVQDAVNKEIPVPVIAHSVMELFRSRASGDETYRAIALMRHGFGGHPFGKDLKIAEERTNSRIKKI